MKNLNIIALRGKIDEVAQKSIAPNDIVRSIILYSLHNENKDVIIFGSISIIDNRFQKEFYDGFDNRILTIFKREYFFGTPGTLIKMMSVF